MIQLKNDKISIEEYKIKLSGINTIRKLNEQSLKRGDSEIETQKPTEKE